MTNTDQLSDHQYTNVLKNILNAVSQRERSISIILTPHLENLFLIYLLQTFLFIFCHLDYQNYKYCVDLKYSKHG